MTQAVFSWKVDAQASADHRFDVRKVQFGEGYEQRQPRFLKKKLQTWSVEKTALADEIEAVKRFLDDCAGVKPFLWAPPDGRPVKVVVDEYKTTHKGGYVWTLSCSFREVAA